METPGGPQQPEEPQQPESQPEPMAERPAAPLEPSQSGPPALRYPVSVSFRWQEEYAQFMPLIKWLILIPHYFVLFFLWVAAFVSWVIAFFAVLFTRRFPRSLFDFNLGVLRWTLRVTSYGYLMNDRYPPFSLGEEPDYPAQLSIEYPEEVDRWRAPFAWIVGLPYALAAGVLQYIASLLAFFAIFTILFTKRYPKGMFDIVDVATRWQFRSVAYSGFMVTKYPPFVWG
ncbi:MAG: DUF4389 domain-containing protein [Thermoleophilaceae bacterium]